MARVRVHTGPISATDYATQVPRAEWPELVRARESFLRVNLPYDCRELLRFVEEAQGILEPLGYHDLEDFITRGLKLDPVMVGWALEGLRRLKPDEAVPFEHAVNIGQLRLRGRPRRDAEKGADGTFYDGSRGSNSTPYLAARLARDRPDILARLQAGEFPSVRAAAKAAGLIKEPTFLQLVQRGWAKASPEERAAVLTWLLQQRD
jgi:hypothetical protein